MVDPPPQADVSRLRGEGVTAPDWWSALRPGDKIRRFGLIPGLKQGDLLRRVGLLNHVIAVAEHNGEIIVTGAQWIAEQKRWLYVVHRGHEAELGSIWIDGTDSTSETVRRCVEEDE